MTKLSQPNGIHQVLLPMISVIIFGLAAFAVYHLVDEISVSGLIDALSRLSPSQWILALILSAASYLVMAGYDLVALHYIGRDLPFRTIMLGAFCGCAVSNAVGMNVLTGGSVRYRIYVAAGLSSFDVARITLIGMIAFGFCTSVVGAAAITLYPELFAQFFNLPANWFKIIGATCSVIILLVLLFTFMRNAPVKVGNWHLNLPSGPVTLAQLLLAVVEMMFAGGCLYVLLPHSEIPFIAFLIVYAAAVVIGMASHVPSGLGVFESITLFTFRDAVSADSMVAALLAYRVIYHLIPLIIAVFILTSRELLATVPNTKLR